MVGVDLDGLDANLLVLGEEDEKLGVGVVLVLADQDCELVAVRMGAKPLWGGEQLGVGGVGAGRKGGAGLGIE